MASVKKRFLRLTMKNLRSQALLSSLENIASLTRHSTFFLPIQNQFHSTTIPYTLYHSCIPKF